MTEFIVGLKIDNLLSMMVPFIYMCVVFGAAAFDHLLFAGFGLLPRNQKIVDNIRKNAAIDPLWARLAAFITGLTLAAISYGCWWLALLFLEVWLGQA